MSNTDSTTAQNTTISQLDKANEVLKGLAVNVTSEDRKLAEKNLKVSRFTTTAYLAGNGADLDTAMKFIVFLQGRIDDRQKKLDDAIQKSELK